MNQPPFPTQPNISPPQPDQVPTELEYRQPHTSILTLTPIMLGFASLFPILAIFAQTPSLLFKFQPHSAIVPELVAITFAGFLLIELWSFIALNCRCSNRHNFRTISLTFYTLLGTGALWVLAFLWEKTITFDMPRPIVVYICALCASISCAGISVTFHPVVSLFHYALKMYNIGVFFSYFMAAVLLLIQFLHTDIVGQQYRWSVSTYWKIGAGLSCLSSVCAITLSIMVYIPSLHKDIDLTEIIVSTRALNLAKKQGNQDPEALEHPALPIITKLEEDIQTLVEQDQGEIHLPDLNRDGISPWFDPTYSLIKMFHNRDVVTDLSTLYDMQYELRPVKVELDLLKEEHELEKRRELYDIAFNQPQYLDFDEVLLQKQQRDLQKQQQQQQHAQQSHQNFAQTNPNTSAYRAIPKKNHRHSLMSMRRQNSHASIVSNQPRDSVVLSMIDGHGLQTNHHPQHQSNHSQGLSTPMMSSQPDQSRSQKRFSALAIPHTRQTMPAEQFNHIKRMSTPGDVTPNSQLGLQLHNHHHTLRPNSPAPTQPDNHDLNTNNYQFTPVNSTTDLFTPIPHQNSSQNPPLTDLYPQQSHNEDQLSHLQNSHTFHTQHTQHELDSPEDSLSTLPSVSNLQPLTGFASQPDDSDRPFQPIQRDLSSSHIPLRPLLIQPFLPQLQLPHPTTSTQLEQTNDKSKSHSGPKKTPPKPNIAKMLNMQSSPTSNKQFSSSISNNSSSTSVSNPTNNQHPLPPPPVPPSQFQPTTSKTANTPVLNTLPTQPASTITLHSQSPDHSTHDQQLDTPHSYNHISAIPQNVSNSGFPASSNNTSTQTPRSLGQSPSYLQSPTLPFPLLSQSNSNSQSHSNQLPNTQPNTPNHLSQLNPQSYTLPHSQSSLFHFQPLHNHQNYQNQPFSPPSHQNQNQNYQTHRNSFSQRLSRPDSASTQHSKLTIPTTPTPLPNNHHSSSNSLLLSQSALPLSNFPQSTGSAFISNSLTGSHAFPAPAGAHPGTVSGSGKRASLFASTGNPNTPLMMITQPPSGARESVANFRRDSTPHPHSPFHTLQSPLHFNDTMSIVSIPATLNPFQQQQQQQQYTTNTPLTYSLAQAQLNEPLYGTLQPPLPLKPPTPEEIRSIEATLFLKQFQDANRPMITMPVSYDEDDVEDRPVEIATAHNSEFQHYDEKLFNNENLFIVEYLRQQVEKSRAESQRGINPPQEGGDDQHGQDNNKTNNNQYKHKNGRFLGPIAESSAQHASTQAQITYIPADGPPSDPNNPLYKKIITPNPGALALLSSHLDNFVYNPTPQLYFPKPKFEFLFHSWPQYNALSQVHKERILQQQIQQQSSSLSGLFNPPTSLLFTKFFSLYVLHALSSLTYFVVIPAILPYLLLGLFQNHPDHFYVYGLATWLLIPPIVRLVVAIFYKQLSTRYYRTITMSLAAACIGISALLCILLVNSPYTVGWSYNLFGIFMLVLIGLVGLFHTYISTSLFYRFHTMVYRSQLLTAEILNNASKEQLQDGTVVEDDCRDSRRTSKQSFTIQHLTYEDAKRQSMISIPEHTSQPDYYYNSQTNNHSTYDGHSSPQMGPQHQHQHQHRHQIELQPFHPYSGSGAMHSLDELPAQIDEEPHWDPQLISSNSSFFFTPLAQQRQRARSRAGLGIELSNLPQQTMTNFQHPVTPRSPFGDINMDVPRISHSAQFGGTYDPLKPGSLPPPPPKSPKNAQSPHSNFAPMEAAAAAASPAISPPQLQSLSSTGGPQGTQGTGGEHGHGATNKAKKLADKVVSSTNYVVDKMISASQLQDEGDVVTQQQKQQKIRQLLQQKQMNRGNSTYQHQLNEAARSKLNKLNDDVLGDNHSAKDSERGKERDKDKGDHRDHGGRSDRHDKSHDKHEEKDKEKQNKTLRKLNKTLLGNLQKPDHDSGVSHKPDPALTKPGFFAKLTTSQQNNSTSLVDPHASSPHANNSAQHDPHTATNDQHPTLQPQATMARRASIFAPPKPLRPRKSTHKASCRHFQKPHHHHHHHHHRAPQNGQLTTTLSTLGPSLSPGKSALFTSSSALDPQLLNNTYSQMTPRAMNSKSPKNAANGSGSAQNSTNQPGLRPSPSNLHINYSHYDMLRTSSSPHIIRDFQPKSPRNANSQQNPSQTDTESTNAALNLRIIGGSTTPRNSPYVTNPNINTKNTNNTNPTLSRQDSAHNVSIHRSKATNPTTPRGSVNDERSSFHGSTLSSRSSGRSRIRSNSQSRLVVAGNAGDDTDGPQNQHTQKPSYTAAKTKSPRQRAQSESCTSTSSSEADQDEIDNHQAQMQKLHVLQPFATALKSSTCDDDETQDVFSEPAAQTPSGLGQLNPNHNKLNRDQPLLLERDSLNLSRTNQTSSSFASFSQGGTGGQPILLIPHVGPQSSYNHPNSTPISHTHGLQMPRVSTSDNLSIDGSLHSIHSHGSADKQGSHYSRHTKRSHNSSKLRTTHSALGDMKKAFKQTIKLETGSPGVQNSSQTQTPSKPFPRIHQPPSNAVSTSTPGHFDDASKPVSPLQRRASIVQLDANGTLSIPPSVHRLSSYNAGQTHSQVQNNNANGIELDQFHLSDDSSSSDNDGNDDGDTSSHRSQEISYTSASSCSCCDDFQSPPQNPNPNPNQNQNQHGTFLFDHDKPNHSHLHSDKQIENTITPSFGTQQSPPDLDLTQPHPHDQQYEATAPVPPHALVVDPTLFDPNTYSLILPDEQLFVAIPLAPLTGTHSSASFNNDTNGDSDQKQIPGMLDYFPYLVAQDFPTLHGFGEVVDANTTEIGTGPQIILINGESPPMPVNVHGAQSSSATTTNPPVHPLFQKGLGKTLFYNATTGQYLQFQPYLQYFDDTQLMYDHGLAQHDPNWMYYDPANIEGQDHIIDMDYNGQYQDQNGVAQNPNLLDNPTIMQQNIHQVNKDEKVTAIDISVEFANAAVVERKLMNVTRQVQSVGCIIAAAVTFVLFVVVQVLNDPIPLIVQ